MHFPKPVPGLVIRYSYLWLSEYRRGQEEGVKDRPCAIVMAVSDEGSGQVVMVVPITHSPPTDPSLAVEIEPETKRRLGLDDDPSWIVLAEANQFVWPGPDLRLGPSGEPASIVYGQLPRNQFNTIRKKLILALEARLLRVVPRTH